MGMPEPRCVGKTSRRVREKEWDSARAGCGQTREGAVHGSMHKYFIGMYYVSRVNGRMINMKFYYTKPVRRDEPRELDFNRMLKLLLRLPTLCKMSERETIVPVIGTSEATQKKSTYTQYRITGRSLVSYTDIFVKDEVCVEDSENASAAPRQH
jgi:hypothetical protein